ncbi:inorganic anion transporter sulfate permease (SulP) family [Klebsiella pneumoniae subsp. ozaenae]|uniref:Inorganic anion transporter sulfate permease (SulP) family n=1 Tax=Klebsiella pneumoniae subsp. ozaenae TaxID=574 RepID=A0A377Z936_KLEPO|nr:inorganic anion transporter sulfate permease (SulP) family [Klebsiella pneumoniae subsp. ozaenae]
MVIVAVKTFSWHSIRPGELARNPWPETLVMLVTVAATVGTSNLAIGVLAGIVAMAIIPRRLRGKSAGYIRNSVARPRKIKKPPVSVMAVIITLEPTAGSRPSFTMTMGIITPIIAAISRLSIMASVITPPSCRIVIQPPGDGPP